MAQRQRPVKVDDPVTAVIESSVKVGAACGCAGFLFGGTSGILKATTPLLFATASGIQTFALGTTFWACRGTFLQLRSSAATRASSDYVQASTLAGGLSGGIVALVTRGRRNVLPATLMWSLFGCLGQVAYDRYSAAPREPQPPKVAFWQRMAEKSWSPVTFMSNGEYADKLREKLFKVDVEIAVLDDKIAALRTQQQQPEEVGTAIAEVPKVEPVP
ncbi:hypothetical protein LTR36_002109 [Oleoguttula mirabilis]|uniref:Uncharacterized protein n=1 Tax=Oleoguttula mirabilis TaxID=1507867 RepID=A0AAV9JM95_9PEZI|nr:hypothetical protein LTR36_002109 [Oleoguttula mirabilis]